MAGRRLLPVSNLTAVFTTVIVSVIVLIGCVPSNWLTHPSEVLIKSTLGLLGAGISTLRLYTEEASYFSECGFQYQPDEIEVKIKLMNNFQIQIPVD